jgi:hypothetical protein
MVAVVVRAEGRVWRVWGGWDEVRITDTVRAGWLEERRGGGSAREGTCLPLGKMD